MQSNKLIIPADLPTILRGVKIVSGPHVEIGDLICEVTVIERKGKMIRVQTPFGPKLIPEENVKNHAI